MNPRAILGWTAGYTALTLLLTYPLVLHLSATVPHDLGDPLLSTSLLWWNAHVLPLTEMRAVSRLAIGAVAIAGGAVALARIRIARDRLDRALGAACDRRRRAGRDRWLWMGVRTVAPRAAVGAVVVGRDRRHAGSVALHPAADRGTAPDAWVVSEITVSGVRRPG